jgi:hypothetical protein
VAIKSEALIYKILERHLKESKHPLSCSDLWEHLDVRENARSAEKVSDYLGLMWRRGMLQRWNTPLTSTAKSRYAYSWHEEEHKQEPAPSLPTPRLVGNARRKAEVTITEEEDRIILDFDKFTMIIQAKG